MLPSNPGEELQPRDENAKADSVREQQQDQDDQKAMIPASTPVPTPRTDYIAGVGHHSPIIDHARRLETELTHALASLASAQVALRDINAEAVSERVWARVMNLSASALADNCAAPWLARLDRRTKTLERIAKVKFGWDGDCGVTKIAEYALEDQ